jgi:hypothetical protein
MIAQPRTIVSHLSRRAPMAKFISSSLIRIIPVSSAGESRMRKPSAALSRPQAKEKGGASASPFSAFSSLLYLEYQVSA